MIYQTDFEKKKTLADGSTNFPDFMIREYGCYFMCLFYLKTEAFKRFNPADRFRKTREFFRDTFLRDWIDYDCFVKNPLPILRQQEVAILPAKDFQKDRYSFVIGRFRLDSMPAGQKSHFVVLNDSLNVIYDPIKDGSQHVKDGLLIDLRVFS